MKNVTDFSLDFSTYEPIAKTAEAYLTLEGKLACAGAGTKAQDLGVLGEWLVAARVAQALLSHNPNVLLFSPGLTCSRRRKGGTDKVELGLHCVFGRLIEGAPNGLTMNIYVGPPSENSFEDNPALPTDVTIPLVSPSTPLNPALVPVSVVSALVDALRAQAAFLGFDLKYWRGEDSYKNELFVVLCSFKLPLDGCLYSVAVNLEIGIDYLTE